MKTIDTLNQFSAQWSTWAGGHLLGTTAALVLVALVWCLIRKRAAAALGCWLFLLVLAKPLMPLKIGVPSAWLPFQNSAAEPASPGSVVPFPNSKNPAISQVGLPLADTMPLAPAPILTTEANTDAASSLQMKPAKLSWQSSLFLVWIAIVTALLLRAIWVQTRTAHWLRRSSPRQDIEAEVDALAAQLGLQWKVLVFSHPNVRTPLVYGLLRPSLMLPEDFPKQLNADQRRWVLLHELAHLKRCDLWVLAVQRLVQIAFFFNPSIWIANRAINRLREYACDDLALLHSNIDRKNCGEGFLRVVEHARSHAIPGAAALALFERGSDSKRRLERILDSRRRLAAGLGLGSLATLLALGLILLPNLRAQQKPSKPLPAPKPVVPKSPGDTPAPVESVAPSAISGAPQIQPPSELAVPHANTAPASLPPLVQPGNKRPEIELWLYKDNRLSYIDERGQGHSIGRTSLKEKLASSLERYPTLRLNLKIEQSTPLDRVTEFLAMVKSHQALDIQVETKALPASPILGHLPPAIPTPARAPSALNPTPPTLPGSNSPPTPQVPIAPPSATVPLNPALTTLPNPRAIPPSNSQPRPNPSALPFNRKVRSNHFRLSVPTPGIVTKTPVKAGQTVKRGDILLQLDSSQAKAALEVAIRKLEVAKIRGLEAKEAEDQVMASIAELESRVERKLATRSSLDAKRSEARELQNNHRTHLSVAEAEVNQASIALQQFVLQAPIGGTVVSVTANVGEYVAPQNPVVILAPSPQASE